MSKIHNRQELRFLILSVIFFGVVLWFLPTSTDDLSQTDCEKIIKLGNEKYLNDFRFDSSWNFENIKCDSPELAILSALHFLDSAETILPSDAPDFDFYKWARKIDAVLRRKEILAFSAKANFYEKRVDISNLELEKANPVSISNILVHELRHLEEGINTHVPCTLRRNATCDAKLEADPFEGGAYNYNVVYLHRLIAYGAITRSQKYSASTLLSNILETRINVISKAAREKYGATSSP